MFRALPQSVCMVACATEQRTHEDRIKVLGSERDKVWDWLAVAATASGIREYKYIPDRS